jgi:molecular chaperone IbpA
VEHARRLKQAGRRAVAAFTNGGGRPFSQLESRRRRHQLEMRGRQLGPRIAQGAARHLAAGQFPQNPVAHLEDLDMRTFDLSPLYRSTVGFDHVFGLLDSLAGADQQTYPPYNIERTGENAYRITMAVAGFGEGDLSLEAKENVLTVKGERKPETGDTEFLYRGIASRAFERRFQLADYVEVKGANLENGLLHIDLVREIPEAMKPRTITIGKGSANGKHIDRVAA